MLYGVLNLIILISLINLFAKLRREQVLALITGEIGSMPDLKKPEDKPDSKQRSFEPHEKDDFTVVKKQEDNKKSPLTGKKRKLTSTPEKMQANASGNGRTNEEEDAPQARDTNQWKRGRRSGRSVVGCWVGAPFYLN